MMHHSASHRHTQHAGSRWRYICYSEECKESARAAHGTVTARFPHCPTLTSASDHEIMRDQTDPLTYSSRTESLPALSARAITHATRIHTSP